MASGRGWFGKEVFVFRVTFFFEVLDGDETETGRVNAIPQSGWRGSIGKNVTEVRVARGRADFNAFHPMRVVAFFLDFRGFDRANEAWPSRSGIKFVARAEEWFSRDDANVEALAVVVPKFIAEWRFGSALHCDVFLKRSE